MQKDEQPLPKKLRITPDKLEQIESDQQDWAYHSPFASLSGWQIEQSNAHIFLRDMEEAIKQGLTADDSLKSRMAENYAIIGNYKKAVAIESNKEERREYLEILEAIERDDDEFCQCEKQKGELELANDYVKRDVWSAKHGKMMPMVTCRNCGHSNVTNLPKELKKLREARKNAIKGIVKTTREIIR